MNPSPISGEGGARRAAVGGRGRALARAREMRKNPTEAERALWRLLRNKRLAGWKWKRQQQLDGYIVDFVCFEARLIVEADGSQHIDSAYDAARDAYLRAQRFRLMRFYNNDILARADAVLISILDSLQSDETGIEPASPLTPLPRPSPARGEGEEGTPQWLTPTTSSFSAPGPAAMSRRSARRSSG
ncbi:MAG: endonuclease domain-containing protein [Sphingomonas sp.]|nr:DUF559 domain-containing protein [Sphingomonas sp.]THD35391.1 MAG: endonuclease domain-containing protein [Sphingomonas sp.]